MIHNVSPQGGAPIILADAREGGPLTMREQGGCLRVVLENGARTVVLDRRQAGDLARVLEHFNATGNVEGIEGT